MIHSPLINFEIIFCIITACAALARPVRFAAILGYDGASTSAMNEVRSQYGGFFGAVAVVLLLVVAGRIPLETGFIVGAMIFGGLAFGRFFSLVVTRKYFCMVPTVRGLVFVDPVLFLLNLSALGLWRPLLF